MDNYVAIDLEMTGLDAKRDSILEVGAIRVKDGDIEAVYQALIHPHIELPQEVVGLTGITNGMVDRQGREMDDVFPEIMAFCGESVLLGHNVIFDYGFLKQAAKNRNIEFERMGIDTLKIARKLLTKEDKKTLQDLCDRFGIQREHRHRALDDAKAASSLYQVFRKQYGQKPEIFEPYPLVYHVKKQSPATNRQKNHLKELAGYHKVELNLSWETLTKNEASRQIDKIIAQYGRMPK